MLQTKTKGIGMNKKIVKLISELENIAKKNKDIINLTNHSIVACALITKTGKVFKGINVAWWHSMCAEVVALGNAFMAGERDFEYLVSVRLDKRDGTTRLIAPCGICREMFDEFKLRHVKCILKNQKGEFEEHTVDELLPWS